LKTLQLLIFVSNECRNIDANKTDTTHNPIKSRFFVQKYGFRVVIA